MAAQRTGTSPQLFDPLDHVGPLPLWSQIADRLERAITIGEFPLESRLDSEVLMASRFGVSRQTIRRAQQELVVRGLVVRRRGLGTQVTSHDPVRHTVLTGLWDEISAGGKRPSTVVVSWGREQVDAELAARMGLGTETVVTRVERVRLADGTAIALLVNWFPPSVRVPSVEELTGRGLYPLLRDRGLVLRSAEQSITGRPASRHESRLLDAVPGAPVIEMTRLVRDGIGGVVEFGRHCTLAGAWAVNMTLIGA